MRRIIHNKKVLTSCYWIIAVCPVVLVLIFALANQRQVALERQAWAAAVSPEPRPTVARANAATTPTPTIAAAAAPNSSPKTAAASGRATAATNLGAPAKAAPGTPANPATAPTPAATPAPTPAATPAPPPAYSRGAVTIPELSARFYGGSGIVSIEELGVRDGYQLRRIGYISDGLREYSVQAIPTTAQPAAGFPLVAIAHGVETPRQFNLDNSAFADFLREYTKIGIMVVVPDYRGHRYSEGSAESAYFSAGYVIDVLNLLAVMRVQPNVNTARIGVVGYSMGGNIALRTAVIDRNVKALVLLAGSTGRTSDAALLGMPSENSPYTDYSGKNELFALHGVPTAASDFWRSMNGIDYVSRTNALSDIHHCVDDSTVPVRFSDDLYAALLAANKGVVYNRCASGGHSLGGFAESGILAQTVSFIQTNLNY